MLHENTAKVYVVIDSDLKKKTQKQAIDIDIDYKDYVSLALNHYSDHIESKEIDFDSEITD